MREVFGSSIAHGALVCGIPLFRSSVLKIGFHTRSDVSWHFLPRTWARPSRTRVASKPAH